MTHEQFIKFDTARLARQAGFDWKCNERYNERYATNDSEPLYVSPRDNWNRYAGLYSAPTQSVLQRWLREVKDIIVLVDYNEDNDCEENERYGVTIYIGNERIVELATYPTYEEALEAGEQKCLTILIKKQ